MICRHLRRLEQELNAAGIPQVWRHERVETSTATAADNSSSYREHFELLPWVLTALAPRLAGLRCPHCGAPIHHAYSGVPGQALECRACRRDMSKPASESPPPPRW